MRNDARCWCRLALGIALLSGWGGAAVAATPMISMGDKHGLALRSDGTVLAWGSDEFGQLGVGRTVYSALAAKVPGLAGVKAIGSGTEHTLAVKSDGTVWAWGKNLQGQLGDGSRADRATPVQTAGMSSVSAVAAGTSHTIALKQDGTVWGWGGNFYGQLGAGTSVAFYDAPVQASGLSQIISIAAGIDHSIALHQDGTVWTWGTNQYGQLGNGTTADQNLAVQVPGLTDVVAIAAGYFMSAALKRDGSVWEWGIATATGGGFYNRTAPVQSSGVSGAVALGAGGYSIAAVLPDGTVWQWGVGGAPAPLAGASGVSKPWLAGTHALFLKTDQSVLAFGNNKNGQLGDGTTIERWSPVAVAGLSGVVALAGGMNHSAALGSDGSVWTWGSDSVGQLGRGTVTTQSIPAQVSGLSEVIYVAAGQGHSLAVKQDGTVWAWGYNEFGQLGDGTHSNQSTPVAASGMANVVAVAAGGAHSLALKQDGSLWAWGYNYDGAIGDGSNTDPATPIQVPGMTGVAAIAAAWHSLAVKQDGTVWAWGRNDYGMLGLGTVNPQDGFPSTANARPAQIAGLANIRGVAASACNSYAVGADGAAWGWGGGAAGLPGCDSAASALTPQTISGVSQVTAMAAGLNHVLAYRADGAVWGWGRNYTGALGDAALAPRTTPAPLGAITGVTQVSAGGSSSAFLRQDGAVSMTGDNGLGQLGDGTFALRRSPVLVVNEKADGFLNLNPVVDLEVPPAMGVPFFVVSSGGITDSSASVSTTAKFNASDLGKDGAVFVTAMVPSGSLVPAASPMNAAGAPAASPATGSSAFVLVNLTATGWQTVANGQLLPYATGVLGDQLAAQTILNGADTSNLKGAQFCLGYGTSAAQMTASGNIRVVASIPDLSTSSVAASTCIVAGPSVSYSLALPQGWNLLGNSLNQSLSVTALFNDANTVTSVWKWDAGISGWQFYTPLMTATELQNYATSKGYAVLATIDPGEGYWVNAKAQPALGTQSGDAFILTGTRLMKGWNLVATGNDVTPTEFNAGLKASAVPVNLSTLWAWDNPSSSWYFYSPSLEAQGGTALSGYIAGKGYLDFDSNNKTLGNGTGFWVNR